MAGYLPGGKRTGTARVWFVSQLLNDPSSRKTHATGLAVRHRRQGGGESAPVLRRRETCPSPLPIWKRLSMKKKAGAGSADAAQRVRQALTGCGRGRLQVLQRALADEAAIDPQLLDAYVDALRDRYGDLVRFVATRILPAFGPSAAKKLRPRLNLKGKASDG